MGGVRALSLSLCLWRRLLLSLPAQPVGRGGEWPLQQAPGAIAGESGAEVPPGDFGGGGGSGGGCAGPERGAAAGGGFCVERLQKDERGRVPLPGGFKAVKVSWG